MRNALLIGNGLKGNNIFDSCNQGNRDNCFDPYIKLRKGFYEHGCDLNTFDVGGGQQNIFFQLHQDVNDVIEGVPAYLMLLETPMVRPQNRNIDSYACYRKVFTWNDHLVDGEKFIKINTPNFIVVPDVTGFDSRPNFCCIIAGNKAPVSYDPRELYSERVKAIRWFESNAHTDFALFGVGWGLPQARCGRFGRMLDRISKRLYPFFNSTPFPSYQGRVDNKSTVLRRTKFSICYENIRDETGYITEKIFDSFFSGCVPVYWGADNINDHVPSDCFVDRRNFRDTASLYKHLKEMDENTFIEYQKRIVEFLSCGLGAKFSSEVFAETIVSAVMADLKS